MSMFEKIASEQLSARKSKDTIKAALLTTVLGEFSRGQTKEAPADVQVFSTLTKFENNIKETLKLKNTPELETELLIIQELLALKPAGASAAEVEQAVLDLLATAPETNQGLIMKHLKASFGDRLDGKAASQQVKEILAR